ncbi:MAG: acyl-CoA dehydrogenase family protein [Candidatus Eremiobacteraeota bacterium]|nr:acyl-CoA dehydrogenase family protein [Candidatus Eremiobacteraeota bacterium]
MDFTLSPQLQEFQLQLRDFLREHVYPIEKHFDETRFRELLPDLEKARARVKERGWWAPALPKELGGMGLSLLDFATVSEELGRSPLGHYVFNCQAPDISTMELLHVHATAEQKERYLQPLAQGEIRSCFGMTEPDYPGSNPVWMGTVARRDGDDYVLNGRKWFCSSADGATFSLVMAQTDPEGADVHKRASLFLVPTDTPGWRLVRNLPVMGLAGQDWPSHAEIALEDCRVPATSMLAGLGQGFALAQQRLGPGRIHHTMRWIGIAERAFELSCQRAVFRQLSPGKTLADESTVQHWVADMRADIESARLLVMRTAWRLEHLGSKEAALDVSLIKFSTAAMLGRVLDRAVQIHGGLGLLDDLPLAFWYRHERGARIYDGTDEVHRASAGRRILKSWK